MNLEWIYRLSGGLPLARTSSTIKIKHNGRTFEYYQDKLGRVWLATGPWSLLRVLRTEKYGPIPEEKKPEPKDTVGEAVKRSFHNAVKTAKPAAKRGLSSIQSALYYDPVNVAVKPSENNPFKTTYNPQTQVTRMYNSDRGEITEVRLDPKTGFAQATLIKEGSGVTEIIPQAYIDKVIRDHENHELQSKVNAILAQLGKDRGSSGKHDGFSSQVTSRSGYTGSSGPR